LSKTYIGTILVNIAQNVVPIFTQLLLATWDRSNQFELYE